MKKENVYDFQVWDELYAGEKIYMIDYVNKEIINLSNVSITRAANFLRNAKNNENYSFFKLIEKEIAENE